MQGKTRKGHKTRVVDLYVQDDLAAQREMSRIARYGARNNDAETIPPISRF